jgi:hypothetical protein
MSRSTICWPVCTGAPASFTAANRSSDFRHFHHFFAGCGGFDSRRAFLFQDFCNFRNCGGT